MAGIRLANGGGRGGGAIHPGGPPPPSGRAPHTPPSKKLDVFKTCGTFFATYGRDFG